MLIFFLMFVGLLTFADPFAQETDKAVESNSGRVERIIGTYGDHAYRAFYSLDELRPFSIIQIDKTIDMYSNKWIEPDRIIAALESEDKVILVKAIDKMICGMKEGKGDLLLEKIENWCKADMHLELIENIYGFDRTHVLGLSAEIQGTDNVISQVPPQGPIDVGSMDGLEKNKAYHKMVNYISSLEFSEQMCFFSDLFRKLSVYAAK